ncbi:MAG: 2OG-Fe(II) oxygenase [Gammaproteobacteria bacterium]|jgi:isopenicillin N synthase-like dioxygenase|nr:2OG-Fe(II) oxygenase [Gammaproteobacteria bacterium]
MTKVRSTAAQSIPVIDISPLRDGSNPAAVAHALLAASRDLGFIYINGHGIPDEVITTARGCALDFFLSPEQEKQRYTISDKHRGWLSQGGAKMRDDLAADLKESFIWGYQDDAAGTLCDHELRGPNQWPDFVPAMESAAMDYFDHADRVARHLLRGFALGLNLDTDFFLRNAEVPLSRASFVYYPGQAESSDKPAFGVGPHTDFGLLTVLCQDHVGGLQVENSSGQWIEAPPIPGSLVVNVGDLLERWTDGAFRSTPHRVINSSAQERLSLVLAFDPNPETMIDAADIYGDRHQAKQDAISCGDYLVWRFAKAFSYRSKDADAL